MDRCALRADATHPPPIEKDDQRGQRPAVVFLDLRRSWKLLVLLVGRRFFAEGSSPQVDEPSSRITYVTSACETPHAALEQIRELVDGHDGERRHLLRGVRS